MNLQIGCADDVPQHALDGISLRFGSISCTVQETDVIMDLEITEGGGGT